MKSSAGRRPAARKRLGKETPRLWTKPLRALTPQTTHGFAVIEFAAVVLGIELFPWQKWLLIHALELNEDGTYRFRKVFVLVGRQNGKTTLLTVLSLWWLYMDADSFPEHLKPHEFLILGTAQNLDIAEEAWDEALKRCDPNPDEEDEHFIVPDLQAETRRPIKTNGKKSMRLKSGAKYEPRAASRMGGRGKSAARIIMDEMREQQTWEVWGSVSKTKNAIFNSQLWGISSAGDAKSVVLKELRAGLMRSLEEWERYVESGLRSVEEFANTNDLASGLFEWSAEEGVPLLDLDGILQANPSAGHKAMFLESILSDLKGDEPEGTKRTEILCQWVTALVDTYLDGPAFEDCRDEESAPADESRLVLGIDTSGDRSMTYLSIAGWRADGRVHGEVIARRAGMLWVVEACESLRKSHGITQVAVQSRGCPAADFAEPLKRAGFELIEIAGTALGASAGQMKDRIRDDRLRHRGQGPLDLAVSGAVTRKLGEVRVWDRDASVVDIAPLVALSNAAYGLESAPEPEPFKSDYEDDDLVVV